MMLKIAVDLAKRGSIASVAAPSLVVGRSHTIGQDCSKRLIAK